MHKKRGGDLCYIKCTFSTVKIGKQKVEKYDSIYVEFTNGNEKKIREKLQQLPTDTPNSNQETTQSFVRKSTP